MTAYAISPLQAAILGVVEGLTEFLPISSTGHLILTSALLGEDLASPAIEAFLVVIQAGALVAVVALYARSVSLMLKGAAGRSPEGLRLLGTLALAFLPAAVAGLLFAEPIKARLFAPLPVALALGVGGAAMLVIEGLHRRRARSRSGIPVEDVSLVSWRMALLVGLAQCLALWPGMSRSMVTILAAMLVGLSPRAAAEFSFLLALPTLGAATAHDLARDGGIILDAAGPLGLILGFGLSCLVAALTMKFLIQYLTRHGLAVFGYYRIVLALVVVFVFRPR